jgi:tetratricopeptide (TPR) repeat protein
MAEILTSNLSHVSAPALMVSLLLLIQCGPRNAPNTKVHAENEQPPELRELLRQGNGFYRSGEYLRAIQIYESGYDKAKRLGSMQSAVKFLHNLGSAHYAMFHYREAIQAYLQARDAATALGNQGNLGNSEYQSLLAVSTDGGCGSGARIGRAGLEVCRQRQPKYKAELLIHYARIRRSAKGFGDGDCTVERSDRRIQKKRCLD